MNEQEKRLIEQLLALQDRVNEAEQSWLRLALGLAAAIFAALTTWAPAPTGLAAHYLSLAILCNAIGIVAGAVAAFAHVNRQRRLANNFHQQLLAFLQTSTAMSPIVSAAPKWYFRAALWVAALAWLTALVALVGYAWLRFAG